MLQIPSLVKCKSDILESPRKVLYTCIKGNGQKTDNKDNLKGTETEICDLDISLNFKRPSFLARQLSFNVEADESLQILPPDQLNETSLLELNDIPENNNENTPVKRISRVIPKQMRTPSRIPKPISLIVHCGSEIYGKKNSSVDSNKAISNSVTPEKNSDDGNNNDKEFKSQEVPVPSLLTTNILTPITNTASNGEKSQDTSLSAVEVTVIEKPSSPEKVDIPDPNKLVTPVRKNENKKLDTRQVAKRLVSKLNDSTTSTNRALNKTQIKSLATSSSSKQFTDSQSKTRINKSKGTISSNAVKKDTKGVLQEIPASTLSSRRSSVKKKNGKWDEIMNKIEEGKKREKAGIKTMNLRKTISAESTGSQAKPEINSQNKSRLTINTAATKKPPDQKSGDSVASRTSKLKPPTNFKFKTLETKSDKNAAKK